MSKIVLWLVRDSCRTADNPALARALAEAKRTGAIMIALACLEPRRWHQSQFGLPRTGPHWRRFRAESLIELRQRLESKGGGLWIASGAPAEALKKLPADLQTVSVVTDFPLAPEEEAENEALENAGFTVLSVETDELFDAAQIVSALEQLPSSFTKFRKTIEEKVRAVPPAPIDLPAIPPALIQPWNDPAELTDALRCPVNQQTEVQTRGGEAAAAEHWRFYLKSGALSTYKQTRNAFSGRTHSSHLSAWLAHGCISPRKIWHDILKYEQDHGANDSTYWLHFELLWREFFRWYARKSGPTLFRRGGPSRRATTCVDAPERFATWCQGETGVAIVDAGMRELKTTGWLSNRARQLVASHLIYESNLDWRHGAAWFESQLVDFDVASNWGNWAYIAGVGPDPRGGRIFNLKAQAERYDPQKNYRDFWLNKANSSYG